MASHGDALFRSTAAWVMGETGDPRFIEILARMLVKPDPTVRKHALAALRSIKEASAQTVQSAPWKVAGIIANPPGDWQRSHRKIHLAVTTESGDLPKLLPTQFILSENGQNVLSYKVVEKPPAEAISVLFVFPRAANPETAPWNVGALKCLAWKRPSDRWASLPFLPTAEPEGGGHIEEPPVYLNSADALATSFMKTPRRLESSELWETLWRCVLPDVAPVRGRRHLIVVVNEELSRAAGRGLIANVLTSRTSLQVIASLPNLMLDEFCRNSRARLQTFEREDQISELVQQAYLHLTTRYEISYQPISNDAVEVKARVQTASGWGEVKIPIPHETSQST